jgi:hypothetical protein
LYTECTFRLKPTLNITGFLDCQPVLAVVGKAFSVGVGSCHSRTVFTKLEKRSMVLRLEASLSYLETLKAAKAYSKQQYTRVFASRPISV